MYPADEVEAIGRWAVEHGIWVITDEIYEHLTYGDHEFTSMPTVVPELADSCVVAQRRRQDVRDDRLAGRLDDRPRPTSSRRRPTSSRTPPRTSPTSPSAAALAAVAGDLDRGGDDARGVRPPRPRRCTQLLDEHRRRHCIEPQGAFYAFPNFTGAARPRRSAAHVAHTTLELADIVLDEAKVAFVPGEAFGAPGYARFSFALGDDDLAEGIRRIAALAAS